MTELQVIFILIVILIVMAVWAAMFIHQDLDNIRKEIMKLRERRI